MRRQSAASAGCLREIDNDEMIARLKAFLGICPGRDLS